MPGGRYIRAMKRVRFAPSPTGSLHVGNALSAVINRREGDHFLLRIDDTDPARNVPGGEEAILADLGWLGLAWDEGPVRQSERQDRYREAAAELGGDRFGRTTLLREDGTATYHLASVVDDADFGITHVYRGNDHRPNEQLHRQLHEALGTTPPEYVHHGLILGEDGKKLSKRAEGSTVASLRELGIPGGGRTRLPRGARDPAPRRPLRPRADPPARDRGDPGVCSDEELADRVADSRSRPCRLRAARATSSRPATTPRSSRPRPSRRRPTRPRRSSGSASSPTPSRATVVRELKAVGGDLRALRLALTGRDRGPELAAILAALPKEEALRRVDQALQHTRS